MDSSILEEDLTFVFRTLKMLPFIIEHRPERIAQQLWQDFLVDAVIRRFSFIRDESFSRPHDQGAGI